jgi:ribose transport system permease protein
MKGRLSQDQIVLSLFLVIFLGFSVFLPGFLSVNNILTLIRSVAALGILGVGMAFVIIGRGIDLTVIANMVISVGFALTLAGRGIPVPVALLGGFGLALVSGCICGILIAYAEIPALFATLAFGTCVYGFGRAFLVPADVIYLPSDTGWLEFLGKGHPFGVPTPVFCLAVVGLIIGAVLQFTKLGKYIYGMGENFLCARITGMPVRIVTVIQYMVSSAIAFLAGIVLSASASGIQTRLFNSTMLYNVILVVVLGGVGLNGGKGGVRNVLVGALLVGALLNGMTIMDISLTIQNLAEGVMLIVAILIDAVVNPRDEQVAQQGDI